MKASPRAQHRFPSQDGVAEGQHGGTVYIREAAIVPDPDTWIATLFDDEHLDSTCETLAAVSDLGTRGSPFVPQLR